jgi:hypothetical protein
MAGTSPFKLGRGKTANLTIGYTFIRGLVRNAILLYSKVSTASFREIQGISLEEK